MLLMLFVVITSKKYRIRSHRQRSRPTDCYCCEIDRNNAKYNIRPQKKIWLIKIHLFLCHWESIRLVLYASARAARFYFFNSTFIWYATFQPFIDHTTKHKMTMLNFNFMYVIFTRAHAVFHFFFSLLLLFVLLYSVSLSCLYHLVHFVSM